jgi:hypothetical protein
MNVSNHRKVQFNSFISEDTVRRFKEMVAKKWTSYSKGLISAEVDQALRYYISIGGIVPSGENREHTHTFAQETNLPTIGRSISGKVVKVKGPVKLSKEQVDKLRIFAEHTKVILDRASKGLRMEANEKERIAEWLVETGKYEDRESIKFIPKSLLQQAITSVENITDNRSINNRIAYLQAYNQIEQTGLGKKQYRLVGLS